MKNSSEEQKVEYAYSLTGDNYIGTYPTREEAKKAAMQDAISSDMTDTDPLYVGKINYFEPAVDAESVVYNLQDSAYDFAGEYAADYLNHITREEAQDLEDILTSAFNSWAQKTNNGNKSFFIVTDVEKFTIG